MPITYDLQRTGGLRVSPIAFVAGLLLAACAAVEEPVTSYPIPTHLTAAYYQGRDINAILVHRGCTEPMAPIHCLIVSQQNNSNMPGELRRFIAAGANVNVQDAKYGNTPLHSAARYNAIAIIQLLLDSGADRSLRNNDGLTPADRATKFRNYGAVAIINQWRPGEGVAAAASNPQGASAPLAAAASATPAPATQRSAPGVVPAEPTEPRVNPRVARQQALFVSLAERPKCKISEEKWALVHGNCVKGLGHGKGTAIHEDGELSFEGTFVEGNREKGVIYFNDLPLYDGALTKGKPHGEGICFHAGEPEKCEYYHGKRVDAVFKQRLAFAQQKQELDAMRQELRSIRHDQRTQQAGAPSQAVQQPGDSSFEEQLKQKAKERLTEEIFNRLF